MDTLPRFRSISFATASGPNNPVQTSDHTRMSSTYIRVRLFSLWCTSNLIVTIQYDSSWTKSKMWQRTQHCILKSLWIVMLWPQTGRQHVHVIHEDVSLRCKYVMETDSTLAGLYFKHSTDHRHYHCFLYSVLRIVRNVLVRNWRKVTNLHRETSRNWIWSY